MNATTMHEIPEKKWDIQGLKNAFLLITVNYKGKNNGDQENFCQLCDILDQKCVT